jgi:hypothetical protein
MQDLSDDRSEFNEPSIGAGKLTLCMHYATLL